MDCRLWTKYLFWLESSCVGQTIIKIRNLFHDCLWWCRLKVAEIFCCGVIKLVTKPSHSLREDICYNVFPNINVVGLIVRSGAQFEMFFFKYYNTEVPSTLRQGNLKTEVTLRKRINYTLRWSNLKTQQSQVILDLCFRKTRTGKSQDYLGFIVFQKLRFCDRLVWTLDLTAEISCVVKFL